MKRFIKIAAAFGAAALSLGFIVSLIENKTTQRQNNKAGSHHPFGVYEKYFKRPIDFALSLIAIILLAPILLGCF